MLAVGSVLLAMTAGLLAAATAGSKASSSAGDGVHGALIELSIPSNRSAVLRLAAQYTRAGSVRPVRGHLVQYHPVSLCDGPVKLGISSGVAVVKLEKIEFDPCSIEQKMETVLDSRTAAVIFDISEQNDVWMQLQSRDKEPAYRQPVLVVAGREAGRLMEALLRGGLTVVHVSPDTSSSSSPPADHKESTVGMYLIVFIVVMLVASVFCAAVVIRVKLQDFGRPLSPTDDIERIVKSLGTRRYRQTSMKLPSYASDVTSLSSLRKEMCAICLEEYVSRQVLRTLPCGHEYHKVCVDPWLIAKRTCPLCICNVVDMLFSDRCAVSETPSAQPSNQAVNRLPQPDAANASVSVPMYDVPYVPLRLRDQRQQRSHHVQAGAEMQPSQADASCRMVNERRLRRSNNNNNDAHHLSANNEISEPLLASACGATTTTRYNRRHSSRCKSYGRTQCSSTSAPPLPGTTSNSSRHYNKSNSNGDCHAKPALKVHASARTVTRLQSRSHFEAQQRLLRANARQRPASCHSRARTDVPVVATRRHDAKRLSYPVPLPPKSSVHHHQWDADVSSLSGSSIATDQSPRDADGSEGDLTATGDSLASVFGSSRAPSTVSSAPLAHDLRASSVHSFADADDDYFADTGVVTFQSGLQPHQSSLLHRPVVLHESTTDNCDLYSHSMDICARPVRCECALTSDAARYLVASGRTNHHQAVTRLPLHCDVCETLLNQSPLPPVASNSTSEWTSLPCRHEGLEVAAHSVFLGSVAPPRHSLPPVATSSLLWIHTDAVYVQNCASSCNRNVVPNTHALLPQPSRIHECSAFLPVRSDAQVQTPVL